jgi:2-methylaconitate cis-trans-isomerase PrpF
MKAGTSALPPGWTSRLTPLGGRPRPFSCLRNHLNVIHKMSYSTRNQIPASYLRGGTSKGIFLHAKDLPEDTKDWKPILLGIMGSPDPVHGRQLNGMGGGISSLSKVCVVRPPSPEEAQQGIDAVYTFVQVGIRDAVLDFSGNCGNLSSMIGVFALDEGICTASTHITTPQVPSIKLNLTKRLATVRSLNTNTNKLIDTTFPVSDFDGAFRGDLELPQATVAGVPGKASQIVLDFLNPAGARTGKLLPSKSATDTITLVLSEGSAASFSVSFIDATNPTVFLLEADLRHALELPENQPVDYGEDAVCSVMERIRQEGAQRMGLDPTAQAQPKVAALGAPDPSDEEADIIIHAFSVGVLHKAVPMTVGLCLGVASGVKGTIAWDIVQFARQASGRGREGKALVTIRHPGGTVDVGASFDKKGDVTCAKVVRTGRRLMKGVVWW